MIYLYNMKKKQLAVVGAGSVDESLAVLAERVGEEIAESGAILVCGGLGGVMEAACRGAHKKGGLAVGIIPSTNPADANDYVDVVISSGLGNARNALVVGSADAVIALPGGYGTISEVALALKMGKKVVILGERPWKIEGTITAGDAVEAVGLALGI
jgi:uncharacterized protein (TIGR00725 family)